LIAGVELGTEDVTEEVADPAAAADLIVEIEHRVVSRERAEGAELELMRALRLEAAAHAGEG